jgi:ribosomal-protein-alanine N-acetyltransferase
LPRLERLHERHAAAVLDFELANRAWFALTIPDRGDDYFAEFARRHTGLLAEQSTGRSHFHVLLDDAGAVLGRFNLVDAAFGGAELGYRVAERATGRGLGKLGVRLVCARAGDEYGLSRLVARAALDNPASLAVLRGTGFLATGPIELGGKPGLLHHLTLR